MAGSNEGMRSGTARSTTWLALRIALGLCLLAGVIALPNEWARLQAPVLPVVPLEWSFLVALLLLAPRGLARILRVALIVGIGALLFVKLADMGTGIAFSRLFNPILDLHLFVSGWHLLSGSVGITSAVLGIAAALAVFTAVLFMLIWGLRGLERLPGRVRRIVGAVLLLFSMAGAGLLSADPSSRAAQWVGIGATQFGVERAQLLRASFRDLASFEAELGQDPAAALPPERLLQGLAGKDVLFLFVESYGRSALEDARYSGEVRRRLDAIETAIGQAGFSARSGWLTAPTVGGQSWLAHAALLSGLWVDSQQRYERLMVSERPSLNRLFAEAGWRTIGVMPAITMDWPEARWYGYEATYVNANLGYRGNPFNWVTMPDQYTLAAMNRLELDRAPRGPVMAEVSLISSHAPWTPIPPLLPWGEIGDGTVFNPYADAGDPPEVVWREPERVRDQYALSIDYALETIGSYVETFGTRDLVLVVLGDHQPASIITGADASRDVPMHVIAADEAVLGALSGWNWTPGLVPSSDAPVWPMDEFRLRFLEAYSGGASG